MSAPARARPTATALGAMAAAALRREALATPKPGLVDARGPGSHTDMDLPVLLRSADALEPWFAAMAAAAADSDELDRPLRRRLGALGREAEARMRSVTGGANTHRGAIWSLGLLVAAAGHRTVDVDDARSVVRAATRIARLADDAAPARLPPTHGDAVRLSHPGVGARAEAQRGFPAALRSALPVLRAGRDRPQVAVLDALIVVMAELDDTCVLHRGGPAGLARVRALARAIVDAGGVATEGGRRRLASLDALCRTRRLSPGGAADVLACALLLQTTTEG